MIYVLGDSHSRSFSFNSNFFPLFIGAGKENNFVNDANTKRLTTNMLNVLSKAENLDYVMFVLGEPDVRFYSGQGWYPWNCETPPDISGYKEKVATSIARYSEMINELLKKVKFKPIIFNVTPSKRVEQNIVVDYYNKCLSDLCVSENIPYISINAAIYSKDENIINENYFGDTVHMNNQIQPLVEQELINYKIIESSNFEKDLNWDHLAVMKKFAFDPKFGCFKLTL